jgi:hypothetical protein
MIRTDDLQNAFPQRPFPRNLREENSARSALPSGSASRCMETLVGHQSNFVHFSFSQFHISKSYPTQKKSIRARAKRFSGLNSPVRTLQIFTQ